jgi:GT2 family glycosyltransferase
VTFDSSKERVLVIGVALSDVPSLAVSITDSLLASQNYEVEVRWTVLGNSSYDSRLTEMVVGECAGGRGKFELLNQMLETIELKEFGWLVTVDDDVAFGPHWLDDFLELQAKCDFDLAQPARTPSSDVSHPFTIQQIGFDARQTTFVEIGPVFAIRQSSFDVLLPFNSSWPMGWGMEIEWAIKAKTHALRLGIIDKYPVEHSFRPTASSYDESETEVGMLNLLVGGRFSSVYDVQQVKGIYREGGWSTPFEEFSDSVALSVILNTRDRPEYLRRVLQSLVSQTIRPELFEVIVIDDGSEQILDEIVAPFRSLIQLNLVRQVGSGIGPARNLGLFMARGHLILFIDDDDWLTDESLGAVLAAHKKWPNLGDAVLGYTVLDPALAQDFLLEHATTERGGELFNYAAFSPGNELSWLEFWGGRISVKREFLMRNGVFDSEFDFGAEDLELSYRLKRNGLKVFFEPGIVHVLFRGLTLENLLRRSRRQGTGLARFYKKHRTNEVFASTARDPRTPLNIDFDRTYSLAQAGMDSLAEAHSFELPQNRLAVEITDAAIRGLVALQFRQGFLDGNA